MNARHHGFTLVELIVVIVILGILAATALPLFVDMTGDARRAAVQGIAGGLRAAVANVQAKWQSQGATGTSVPVIGGTVTINPANGFPTADDAGITAAMGCTASPCQGNTLVNAGGAGGTSTWTSPNAAGCAATYDAATGVVTVTTC